MELFQCKQEPLWFRSKDKQLKTKSPQIHTDVKKKYSPLPPPFCCCNGTIYRWNWLLPFLQVGGRLCVHDPCVTISVCAAHFVEHPIQTSLLLHLKLFIFCKDFVELVRSCPLSLLTQPWCGGTSHVIRSTRTLRKCLGRMFSWPEFFFVILYNQ